MELLSGPGAFLSGPRRFTEHRLGHAGVNPVESEQMTSPECFLKPLHGACAAEKDEMIRRLLSMQGESTEATGLRRAPSSAGHERKMM